MEKDNKYRLEQDLMEAFTYAENADIGMPDIDAELRLVRKKATKPRKSSGIARIATIAASFVVVVALVWSIYSYVGHADENRMNLCVAYVGGECITNEQQVMNMMFEDILNMNDASDIIDQQLNDFFNE